MTARHDGSATGFKTRIVPLQLEPPVKPLAAVLPSSARPALLDAQCERIADESYAIAQGIIGDSPRAEALVQGIFLDAGRALPTTRSDPLRADNQLLLILRERALALAREDRADGLHSAGGGPTEPFMSIPLDMMLPPEFDLVAFRGALATLSDGQRETIDLACYGGLTLRDVALRTGLPLHSVLRQLRLALLVLHRSVQHTDTPAD